MSYLSGNKGTTYVDNMENSVSNNIQINPNGSLSGNVIIPSNDKLTTDFIDPTTIGGTVTISSLTIGTIVLPSTIQVDTINNKTSVDMVIQNNATNKGIKLISNGTGIIEINNNLQLNSNSIVNPTTSANIYVKGGSGGTVMCREYLSCYEASDENKRIDMYYDNGSSVQTGFIMMSRDYYTLRLLGGSSATISPSIIQHGGTYNATYNPNNGETEFYSKMMRFRQINSSADMMIFDSANSLLTLNSLTLNGAFNIIGSSTGDITFTPTGDVLLTGLTSNIKPGDTSYKNQIVSLDRLQYSSGSCGFSVQSIPNLSVSYVPGTRIMTLTVASSTAYYYVNGKEFSLAPGNYSNGVAHTDTTGLYFVYFNTSGTLTIDGTYFQYPNACAIATIYYNNDLSVSFYWVGIAPQGFIVPEFHSVSMDYRTHNYLHDFMGTQCKSGGTMTNYVQNTNTASAVGANTISTATIVDEDYTPTTISGINATGSNAVYPLYYLVGNPGTWYYKSELFPFVLDGSTLGCYNKLTTATYSLTQPSNNNYFNVYAGISNKQWVFISGQAEFNTLQLAQAETISALRLTGFPEFEIVFRYQITYQYKTSDSTVSGKMRVQGQQRITGNSTYITQTGNTVSSLPLNAILSSLTNGIAYSNGTNMINNATLTYDGTSFVVGGLSTNGTTQTITCNTANTNYSVNINGYGAYSITNGSGNSGLLNIGSPLNTSKYTQINIYNSDSSTYGGLLRYYYGGSSAGNYIKFLHGSSDASTGSNIVLYGDGVANINGSTINLASQGGIANVEVTNTQIAFKQNGDSILFPNANGSYLRLMDSLSRDGIEIQSDAQSSTSATMSFNSKIFTFNYQTGGSYTEVLKFVDLSTGWYSAYPIVGGSSKKIKKNIKVIDLNEISKIYKVTPIEYSLLTDPKGTMQNGFIAEDIEALGLKNLVFNNGNLKGLHYQGFIPLLLGCIKHQKEQINEMTKQIIELIEANDKISARIDDITNAFKLLSSQPLKPVVFNANTLKKPLI